MSVMSRYIQICCDGEDCAIWQETMEVKVPFARKVMKKRGWISKRINREGGMKDFCPDCQAKMKLEKP